MSIKDKRIVVLGHLLAYIMLLHPVFGSPILSMRVRSNDTDTLDIWKANFKAIKEHPGCCDEIWFSTGIGVPSLAWHHARAAIISQAIQDVRAQGIVPSLQFQATLGHGDALGSPEMFAQKNWTGWTDCRGLETKFCNCPRQPLFHDYLRKVAEIYAPLGFAGLWIDDDLRISNHHPAKSEGRHVGCWCDTCLTAFNVKMGSHWNRNSLAQVVATNDVLASQWRTFSIDAICQVAKTIATVFQSHSPETMLAFQHAFWKSSADQVSSVLMVLHMTSGKPVGFRPGGAVSSGDNPNDVIQKSLCAGWFRQYIDDPKYVKVWTPEIECYPRTYYSQSSQAILIEGFSALVYGMNSISFFVSNSAMEKPSLFGQTHWKYLAEAEPVLRGYAETIKDAYSVGFTLPEGECRKLGIRRTAIPILAGVGKSVGTLTAKEYSHNVNSMTSAAVQALRDAVMSRATPATLAMAKVASPFLGLMQLHADKSDALCSVALINTRITKQTDIRLYLRNLPQGKSHAVWHEMRCPAVNLPLEISSDGTYVTIPEIAPWNGGYVSFL